MTSGILGGCSFFSGPAVHLLTDQPEMAAYVEVFNAAQTDFKVEISYAADLLSQIKTGETGTDIVIGRGLAVPGAMDRLVPLDGFLDDTDIDPKAFYPALLAAGRSGDSQMLLPVSYELPLVVFHNESLSEIPDTYFSPAVMREEAASFMEAGEEIYRRVGFAPTWEPAFLYYAAILKGVSFSLTADGKLTWDEDLLSQVVEEIRRWLEELDPARLEEFGRSYMRIPQYQLLNDRRILFYVTTARDFLSIPPEKRTELDFRWLGENDRIPVLDDVLYAGLLRERKNRPGARAFLTWFFSPKSQVGLMRVNQYKRLSGVYGIASGLPALEEVTVRELPKPEHYPLFVGHLPPPEFLLVQTGRPDAWLALRDEVVIPWLTSAATGQTDQTQLKELLQHHQTKETN